MILHLITDDGFADYAIKQFNQAGEESDFVMVLSGQQVIQHVKQQDKITVIRYGSEAYTRLLKWDYYTAVITHGLFQSWQEEVLLAAPPHVKIGWVFWGGEIYGYNDLFRSFLSVKTRLLLLLKQTIGYLKGKKRILSEPTISKEIYKRIDYCLTDEFEEYQFVKQYTNSGMEWLWYNYYSIEETLKELKGSQVKGENILLGNSSTFSNNHLDGICALKRMALNGRKLVMPLGYGDPWLRQRLLKICKGLFGTTFNPLTTYMERQQYNEILCSCSVAVFPHYRPQAQGNIITTLWLGAKVYLSEKSMSYHYFKRLGLKIFSIEQDLLARNADALTAVDAETLLENRKLLEQLYGEESMLQKIRHITAVLNKQGDGV